MSAYAEAARVDSAQPSWRIDAARAAAILAERKSDPAEAANLLETAVRMLPELDE